jgi:hypothetical protein
MRHRVVVTSVVAVFAALALASSASARTWAPAGSAPIHPGVMTFTKGAQCTANFVFTSGSQVLLGQAAHCAGTGSSTDTDGCKSETLPEGTPVKIDGALKKGKIVYSSWVRMQALHETNKNACADNDLALIRLSPQDAARTNPSVPFFGGPTGLGGKTADGDRVVSYGNSELRAGISLLSPKSGLSLGPAEGGWTNTIYTVTPGIPGDSGSGFLNGQGQAIGILSTVAVLPLPASNGVGTLKRELEWANAHGFRARLVKGTEPFSG